MRDEFSRPTKRKLAERAQFICSSPDCRRIQIGPSQSGSDKVIHLGKAAHVCAAAIGGPRYDSTQTPEERKSIDNAIYLCSSCADKIDKNNGIDFSAPELRQWKKNHEDWVTTRLNKGELDARLVDNLVWNDVDVEGAYVASTNMVVVNQGITEKRAREVAEEIFERNFPQLAKEASDTAFERATTLINHLVPSLDLHNIPLEAFRDPAVQAVLYDAQKTYALSGQEAKLNVLIKMLTPRISAVSQDMISLILDKSIRTCADLTPAMINTLSLIMTVKYRHAGRRGRPSRLPEFIEQAMIPLVDDLAVTKLELRHLDQTGCIAVSRGTVPQSIAKCFEELYPEIAKQLQETSTRSFGEHLIHWFPVLQRVIEDWDGGLLAHSSLHPVGVCLAWSNLSGSEFTLNELILWLNAGEP